MKRKPAIFFFPLAGLVIGICIQAITPISLWFFTGLTAITAITALSTRKPIITNITLMALFACAGTLGLIIQKKAHQDTLASYQGKTVQLTGKVINKEYAHSPFFREILTIQTDQLLRIHVYAHYKTDLLPSDTIELANLCIQDPEASNLSGNPTFGDYMLKEHIFATIFTANNSAKITCLHRPRYSVRRWLWNLRNTLYQSINSKLSRLSAHYFSLIFLGNKYTPQAETRALRRTCNYWGLAHYLARAGLHISLFIIIWRYILRFIPIHIMIKRLLLMLMCLIYSMLSWPSIPFSRAYFTFLLIQTGALFYRQTNFLHILSLLTTVILLINPIQLFFLDFQLSFGLTMAIAWATGI